MSKGDLMEFTGSVIEPMGGGRYKIRLDESNNEIHARLSGKMNLHRVRVLPGDRVRIAASPYDLTHGMIVYREK